MSGALNSVLGGGGLGSILGGGGLGALGGIVGIAFPPAGIAMAAANLLAPAIGEAVNGAAKQLSQECGMPKFLQDVIGKVVDEVLGKNKQPSDPACDAHVGGNPEVQESKQNFIQDMLKGIFDCVKDEMEGSKKAGGKGGDSGSWLEALAKALGKVAGEKAAKMVNISNQITELSGQGGSKEEQAQKSTELQSQLNGVSKEFSQFMETINNVVKGIGDGLTSVARK
jgi:hypothetical protein